MIDKLKKSRIAVSAFIRIAEEYDGKYWNRLSDDNRLKIASAYAECAEEFGAFGYLSFGSAPTITTEQARKYLSGIEEDIHLFDDLSTDPLVAEWAELMEKAAKLSAESKVIGKHRMFFDAKRLGLVRGTVNW